MYNGVNNMMNNKIQYFENIPAEPENSMILARLGYRKNSTEIDKEHANMLKNAIHLGLGLCRLQGAYGYFDITEKTSEYVKLENGQAFHSEKLAKLLESSQAVVFMACTSGTAITERIAKEVQNNNASVGLILDAVASEKTDAGLDWLMDFINKSLKREGKKLTKYRFSPGYGDLPLSDQKIIYEMLKLQNIGLQLTEKYILIPEKSVLAVAGIERIGFDE